MSIGHGLSRLVEDQQDDGNFPEILEGREQPVSFQRDQAGYRQDKYAAGSSVFTM